MAGCSQLAHLRPFTVGGASRCYGLLSAVPGQAVSFLQNDKNCCSQGGCSDTEEEISALLQKRAIQVVLNTEAAFKCSWPGRLIDLRRAIFHVAIHPNHKHFLRFAFEGVAYEYPVLPFGLSLALCKCAEAPLAPFINKGLSILAYLDDWALVACSKKQAENTAITQLGIWFLFSCYCSRFSLQRGGKKRNDIL